MKKLFIECDMGVSGDMLMAALWELIDDKDVVMKEIRRIGLPNTSIEFDKKMTCSVLCSHVRVLIGGEEEESHHEHHHSHMGLGDITQLISKLNLSEKLKKKVKKVYDIIAEAESIVHNLPVEQVHFHELGQLDALADITVCLFLLDKIGAEHIIVSPINVGSGTVTCAHGVMPVPAPATQRILLGIPYYKSDVNGELCTPTGAAIIKSIADEFSQMPVMVVDKTGCGAGNREFGRANCVRVFLSEDQKNDVDYRKEQISEVVCNIDDMTPEEISFAAEEIFNAGAVDVFTQPIYMKKSRPAFALTALCGGENVNSVVDAVFRHTSTLGVRVRTNDRYYLKREIKTVDTPVGKIRVKISSSGKTLKYKPEYDDISLAAIQNDMTLDEVKKIVEQCLK